jgi:biopolymer transport protein ExbD
MTRRLGIAAVIGLALVAGCTWTSDDDNDGNRIVVHIDHDGQLESQGFTLAAADLPAFAKETGKKSVVLIPRRGTSYGKAVEAKEQMKAAGISDVAIGGASGE